MSAKTPVICFYSFKGGAGRTVCTANFTSTFAKQFVASEKEPVLLVDMDLDSAGLTVMMDCADKLGLYTSAGLVAGSVNLNIRDARREFFEKGLLDASERTRTDAKSVLILGTEVAPRDSTLIDDDRQNYLRDLIGYCEEKEFRGVIIDSASGGQDSARVCQLAADVVICCCRMTDQFYYGTRRHLENFVASYGARTPAILILPVAVPTPSDQFQKLYKDSLDRLEKIAYNLRKAGVRGELFNPGICEVERFKWEESVLSANESQSDAAQAVSRFRDLAVRVMELVSPQTGNKEEA